MALAASACAIIPRDGPATLEVYSKAEVTLPSDGYRLSYALVDLTPLTVDMFAAPPQRFAIFTRASAARGPAEVRIGAGDTVSVAIFEAAGGGLFLPEGSRAGNATIPPQQVDRSGNITVPYAGSVRALGRTPIEVQADIEERLKNRALEPQAIVTVTDKRSNDITVLGDVGGPTRFPAEPSGIKVLNALARAGGTRSPAFETIISVQRGRRTERALMTAVVADPAQNISIAPGDVVYVSREPRAYLAFGATASNAAFIGGSNNRRFVFEEENLTLADGVAKAGGLLDSRADASAVFLYRMVPKQMLARAGVDVSKFLEPNVPTIFRVDLSKADGFFIANSFHMLDQDIIFVSNAPADDIAKFTTLIGNISSAIISSSSAVGELRNFGAVQNNNSR
jgi:polysaccharide export outer membrane protein